MTEQISESRFQMWRTVVALAHTDHKVVPEERDLVDNYLGHLPFSEDQKSILREDLEAAQDVADMFDAIDEPSDRGEFFQFARIMVWSDGDLDAQEDRLFERLKGTQMARLNEPNLEEMIRDSRESAEIRRLQQDETFRREARESTGIGAVFRAAFKINRDESI